MQAKDCEKKIILTGDRPTGKLHLGHFVGSLKDVLSFRIPGNLMIYIFLLLMTRL